MLNDSEVRKYITEKGLLEDGTRNYIAFILLLFGTLEEGQYASVNFFSDTIRSLGYMLEGGKRKVLHSKLNQMCPKYLVRLNLGDLLEDARVLICSKAAGRTSHTGVNRTRSLFTLNEYGKEQLKGIVENMHKQTQQRPSALLEWIN